MIVRFGVINPEAGKAAEPVSASSARPVCDVEGCSIEGYHTHGGVGYCGGAAHHGETCDGSCVYQAQQNVASGHHQEQHHGSHH